MKLLKLLFLFLIFICGNSPLTFSQVTVDVRIENQNAVSPDFFFDIYLNTTSGSDNLYLGNADFRLTFNNANFTSPTIAKEPTTSPGLCTFQPTDPSGLNTLFTQDSYYTNTAVSINVNEIIINLNGPTPSDQTAFDTRVARVDNSLSTHRLGRFKISGITNTSGSMGLTWVGTTQVFTLDPITFNGSVVDLNLISPTDVPLPVELKNFTAKANEESVELKWLTETEVNNYGFEIERKNGGLQKDIASWDKVGFVEGNGNSNSVKNYSYKDKNLSGGSKFIYRLKQIDVDGTFLYSEEVEVELIPDEFELYQNYPNPFNPSTNIKFNLPQLSKVRLDVYNILGQHVVTLIDKEMEAGFYNLPFNAGSLSSGTYIYKLQTKDFTMTKKMLFIK